MLFANVDARDGAKLRRCGQVTTKSVQKLKWGNACVLDPQAEGVLTPAEAKNFDVFIFGGILGDAPEQGRTKVLLTSKLRDVAARNLGARQMPTDNAVFAVKLILEGKALEELQFQDTLELRLKRGMIDEAVVLPFRYVLHRGKPLMSTKLLAYLRKKKDL